MVPKVVLGVQGKKRKKFEHEFGFWVAMAKQLLVLKVVQGVQKCLLKIWAWARVWNGHGQATLGTKSCSTSAEKEIQA